jgi:hypothetical protein
MAEVKIAASTQAEEKTPSSMLHSSQLSDDQGKGIYNSLTGERRNTVLEDGINGANEKHRPMVDIQEYFVHIKVRRNESTLICCRLGREILTNFPSFRLYSVSMDQFFPRCFCRWLSLEGGPPPSDVFPDSYIIVSILRD